MERIVECVPNFSEGRNEGIIKEITDTIEAVAGVKLLDVDPGADTNRTVVTMVGSPQNVAEAAFQAVKRAAQLIDMRQHRGAHPRFGATDVVPFVPVSGVTMDDCVKLAGQVGKRIGEDLGIPVYLYEHAASRPERRNLSRVRTGEYEGLAEKLADDEWQPDFGPSTFNAEAGATAVGAREFLIAYNIDLNTTERKYANEIAYALRERGRWKRTGNIEPFYYKGDIVRFPEDGTYPCGPCNFVGDSFKALEEHYAEVHDGDLQARYEALGIDPENPSGPVFNDGQFKDVKAIGWVVDDYNRAQISINLNNYKVSPAHEVFEAAREEASKRGISITGSEIVGVVPYEAMRQSAVYYLRRMRKSTGIPVPDLVETAIQSLGLRDGAPFETKEKVLGMPGVDGPLAQRATFDFVDAVSRDSPAPGGGSVAALAGALGGALAAMVANLSVSKGEFDDQYEALCKIADQGQAIKDKLVRGVDQDTAAFDLVIEAMRMPRDTETERDERATAMEEGYKVATCVPLATVEQCRDALRLCAEIAPITDPNMVSDVGTGALLANAGAQAAAYNVRINLPHITDQDFEAETHTTLTGLLEECSELAAAVAAEVERSLGS